MRAFRCTYLQLVVLAMLAAASAACAQSVQSLAHPSVRITQKVNNAVTVKLPDTHPQLVDHAVVGSRLAASKPLSHLRLVLSSSDEQETALESYMGELQDKTSPNFHKWLTPDAFGAQFGASQEDIATISAWLQDQGFSIDSVAKGNRILVFSGTVGQVETAFQTRMAAVTIHGVQHFSNTTDISIPQALAPVVRGIARLNDIFPTRSPGKVSTVQLDAQGAPVAPIPYYGAATGTHYVTPGDAAIIYNTKPLTTAGVDGTGTTIAVLAQSNINLADVEKFRGMFGLPKNDPTVTLVGSDPGENQDDVEAFLDAEWAGAMAPGASVNFLVSQPTLENGGVDASAQYAVENNVGDIISLSYGGCELDNGAAGTAFYNILWQQAAAQGQTVFVSSGDSGAAGCDSSGNSYAVYGYGVNALGSSNYNVAMGGSIFVDFNQTLYWSSTGTTVPFINALSYIPEAPVNQGRLAPNELNAASTAYVTGSGIFSDGGGISIYTARPSWQTGSGIPTTTDAINVYSGTGISSGSTITGLHRLVPDLVNLSANGHDGTLFCAGSICSTSTTGSLTNAGIVGGTSVATPVQASIQALINEKNGGRQGNILPILYKLANTQYTASTTACQATLGTSSTSTPTLPASTCNFQDVVSGNNVVATASTGTAGIGFSAGVGFDEASGLGSMNVSNVANNWSSVSLVTTTTTFTLSPTAGVTHGGAQNLTVNVAAASGTPTGNVSLIAQTTTANGPRVYTLTSGSFSGTVSSATTQYDTTGDLLSTALPAGTYNVYVHYAGDGTYAPSDSAVLPVSIAKEGSSVSTTSYNITTAGAVNTASSFAYGSSVYLDTYVNASSGKGIPTGTVTYALSQNGTALASLTTTLDPTANTFLLAAQSFVNFYLKANYTALSPGTYVVTETYSGDATFNSSTSTTTFTISTATPAVTFTAPADIVPASTAVLGYKIASLNTSANPNTAVTATGLVTFLDTTSATALGTCTLSGGACNLSTTGIATSGANTITAVYSGDTNYSPVTSTATVTVGSSTAPTVTLTESGNASVGGIITLRATLSITTATGTVAFYDGTTYLGTCTLSSGVCSLANGTSGTGGGPFTAGTHSFSAVYSGSTSYSSATGTLSQAIAQNTTSLAFFSLPNTSIFGKTVTLSITLNRSPTTSAAALVPPTGTVNFYADGSNAPFATSGQPFFDPAGYGYYVAAGSSNSLGAGTHTITASYAGDTNFAASSSTSGLTITVAPVTPTITLTSNASVYATGSPVTLTAFVPGLSNVIPPSNGVTFTNTGNTATYAGTFSYSATAGGYVASLSLGGLTGTNTYTATLNSDPNYSSVTSAPLTVIVDTNNVWIANGNGTVSGLSNAGTAVTPSGVSGGGTGIAIDSTGDVWSLSTSGSSVTEHSNSGTLTGTYTAGGITTPTALAFDGAGLLWITNGNNTLSALTSAGTAVSTSAYSTLLATPSAIVVDGSGDLWITNTGDNSLVEVIGAATPVLTPQTTAVKNNTVAAKP